MGYLLHTESGRVYQTPIDQVPTGYSQLPDDVGKQLYRAQTAGEIACLLSFCDYHVLVVPRQNNAVSVYAVPQPYGRPVCINAAIATLIDAKVSHGGILINADTGTSYGAAVQVVSALSQAIGVNITHDVL